MNQHGETSKVHPLFWVRKIKNIRIRGGKLLLGCNTHKSESGCGVDHKVDLNHWGSLSSRKKKCNSGLHKRNIVSGSREIIILLHFALVKSYPDYCIHSRHYLFKMTCMCSNMSKTQARWTWPWKEISMKNSWRLFNEEKSVGRHDSYCIIEHRKDFCVENRAGLFRVVLEGRKRNKSTRE